MKLHLDASKGFYGSCVGLNMYPFATSEYTVVFKLYFPSASIGHSTVQISATSRVETVLWTSTNIFSDQSWSIIHLHKYNNVTPNYLTIGMVLKNKSGISYTQDLQILSLYCGVHPVTNAQFLCDVFVFWMDGSCGIRLCFFVGLCDI